MSDKLTIYDQYIDLHSDKTYEDLYQEFKARLIEELYIQSDELLNPLKLVDGENSDVGYLL